MKKTLLLCMAVSGLFTLNAQNVPQLLRTAGTSTPPVLNKETGLGRNLQATPAFGKGMVSRSLEDHVMDPKVMGNFNTMANTYRASLSCNKAISLATCYNESLVKRFKGNKISAIYTAISPGTSSATFWIKKDLEGESVWEATLPQGFTTGKPIGIECDYVVDDESPLFVGCTLSLPTLASSSTAYIYFSPDIKTDYCMLIDNNDGAGWTDYSSNGSLYLICQTEGEKGLADNDVQLSSLNMVDRVQTSGDYSLTGSFTNYGAYPVLSFKSKFTINGEEKELEVKTDTLDFMETAYFNIPNQAPKNSGRYPVNFEISAVNGVADGYPSDNATITSLVAMDKVYKRKAVMEEFTGTWCGWCPSGSVAMEKLATDYPDSFIGIGVHGYSGSTDPFVEDTYAPLTDLITTYPLALMNRLALTDPYYGFGEENYGIKDVVEEINNMPSEAVMGLSSTLSADKKEITVTSYTRFGYDNPACPYLVAYVLLEDGLQAMQTNYYSNEYAGQTGLTYISLPQDLKFLYNEGGMYQATYNHVARGIYDCVGIEGSLAGAISSKEAKAHTYTLTVPATVENVENTSIVALLIDAESGEIVTAEKAKVGEEVLTGIGAVNRNDAAAEINVADGAVNVSAQNATASIYTVDGRLVASVKVSGKAALPTAGLSGVHVVRVDDGQNVVVKKIRL